MELTILHLYPDCMSLYGEYANVAVLRRYLEHLTEEHEETEQQDGVTVRRTVRTPLVSVTVKTALFEDTPDFEHADFVYMGAGTERTQKAALSALLPHKDALKAAIDRGAVVLFTGNAMDLLGASITDGSGKVWTGLGLADFTTVETDRRDPGDVVACTDPVKTQLFRPVVGFMNKCSVTHGVRTPMFRRMELGFGNEEDKGPEGYVDGNVLATHVTGPLLVKNPDVANAIVRHLFAVKGWEEPRKQIFLEMEEAYRMTLRQLLARAETDGKKTQKET